MKTILFFTLLGVAALSQGTVWKIDSKVQQAMKTKSDINIMIDMGSNEATLARVVSTFTEATPMAVRVKAVHDALVEFTTESQKSVLQFLAENHKGEVKAFWITNLISVKNPTPELIQALALRRDVKMIKENAHVQLDDTVNGISLENIQPRAEWGIDKIEAPAAHEITTGQGIRVCIVDTGVRQTHEALRGNYAGDANYGFHDAVNRETASYDDNGHGTHCAGTVAGQGARGIGVAPGATWTACKGLSASGGGTFDQLIECGQWATCPDTGVCQHFNHVVSNSWGAAGGGLTLYDDVIRAMHAANVYPIFAAGNSGSSCSSVGSPADSSTGPVAVGATDINDGLASFSSRGPEGAHAYIPQISAPGVNVVSAGHNSDTAYVSMSGTSMACPHAAGLFALVRSQHPNWTVQQALRHIESHAERETINGPGQTCGGIPDTQWPNHHFGWGRINARRAIHN